jgi:hypothetical protein
MLAALQMGSEGACGCEHCDLPENHVRAVCSAQRLLLLLMRRQRQRRCLGRAGPPAPGRASISSSTAAHRARLAARAP